MTKAILNTYGIATTAGDITVYNYDAETREYLSQSVEYLAEGVGIPADSCTDKPGKNKAGFTICRNENFNGWEYVADHRGEDVYKTDTREKLTIQSIGEYPENTTCIAPVTEFDKWSGTEWITDEQAMQAAAKVAFEQKIQLLISEANTYINSKNWPSKLQLNRLSETEKAKFNAWLDYIDELDLIEPSQETNVTLPLPPEK
ncbi:tail fiber assembly protein [Trabulsiella odontotermitis]|uniref:tail fiber assembly protein n=1 Tax=Trabulsiella odontotermitis TaxID=379893 RepID=UPI003AD45278